MSIFHVGTRNVNQVPMLAQQKLIQTSRAVLSKPSKDTSFSGQREKGNSSCCDFMSAMTVLNPEDIVLQHPLIL
ncbi:hypothetical protein STEG23_010488 [Scotinomys teguina]